MKNSADEPRGWFAAWARFVTARPWVTLGVTVVVTAVCLWNALRIQPATGVQDMLADDQPAAVAFGQIVGNYALVDDLVVLARLPDGAAAPDPDRLIAFAERLETELADEEMVADLRYRPSAEVEAFVQDVVIPHGLYYLDDAQRTALRERLTPDAMAEQFKQNAAMLAVPGPAAGRLAKELIRDPLRLREFLADRTGTFGTGGQGLQTLDGVDALISRDGSAIMVRLSGEKSASDLEFTAAFMPRIREAVARANADGLTIDYTGAYAIAELSAGETKADMIRSCVGSITLLVVLFLLVYRHPLTLLSLMLPVYVAIVAGFGVYAAISGRLTPVTAVAGAVLAGLGIDYCVHLLAHHEAERRAAPDAPQHRVAPRTVATVGPAILAACVTTVIGFGAVGSSSVQSLREFALLGVLGLGFALLAAVTVLPAMLCALGNTPLAKRGLSRTRFHVAPLVHGVARRPASTCGVALGLTLVVAVLVLLGSRDDGGWRSPVAFDSDLHALHPRPHPPLEAQDTLAELFGAAPNSLMIHIEADDAGQMLARADAVQRRLAAADDLPVGVAGLVGPASLLPPTTGDVAWSDAALQTALEHFRAAADAQGFNAAAFGEYESFLETLLTNAPPTFAQVRGYPGVAGTVLPRGEAEARRGLVLATLTEPWGTVADRNDSIDAVRALLDDLPGATLTGISVIGYDTQVAIGRDLSKLLLIAAGAVVVWLLVFFRRPGDVVLALLPAATGVLALLVCGVVFGWTLNAINLIALPMIVGIGVDDGIFITAIHRRCRRLGLDRATLINHLAASAHAVVMTSLTTGLAFGALSFTSVPAIRSLGQFTAVGVAAAMLASLFGLIPWLILRYRDTELK
ncbi:MAG: MMPL family transporter [Planctomycetota bacterium]